MERVLGPDHPDTLTSRNNLALAYQAVGRHDEAEELLCDKVPSERDIVEHYGVSRATATKVLAILRADGLVESRPGSGTVVRSSAGFADFALQRAGKRVAVVHTPCGSRQEVMDLREAATWATAHRCAPDGQV
jgi:DNA-binding transcriptional MocR family regulator